MALDRLEELIDELDSVSDEQARRLVFKAVGVIFEFHRELLEHLFALLRHEAGESLIDRLLQDPVLSNVLSGYELWRPGAAQHLVQLEVPASPPGRTRWVSLLQWADVTPGTGLVVSLLDEQIVICNSNGIACAFRNKCPVDGQKMFATEQKPVLNQSVFPCPCHDYLFDVEQGRAVQHPELDLDMLPVEVADDIVKVRL